MFSNFFKTALRNLRRHKGYAAINIFGLALGLAAFWMIALYVADELSFDRFNKNADRIVRVVQHASWDGGGFNIALTSAPFAPALKAAFPAIEETVRIDPEGGGIITYGDKKIKEEDIIFADSSLLNVFSYQFLYGNAATALAHPQSIVVTESLADKLFGTAANALNQTVYFNDHDGSIITGVIKDIPSNSQLRFSAVRPLPPDYTEGWQDAHLYTYLLLAKGTDYRDLQRKMAPFAAGTIQKEMKVQDYRLELQPLTSIHLHSGLDYEMSPNGSIGRVYSFIAIALLILLAAIINYMNLSTARAASRVREVGVRKAIGSGKWHLAGMFLTESVLVTLIAAAIAVLVIHFTLPFFNRLSGKELSLRHFGVMDTAFLLAAFSLLTGVLSGIYPSLFLSRFKAIPALKGEVGSRAGNILFRKSLVIFQFVVTVVMMYGSIVIYRQLHYALHADLGFNKEQVLTFHIDDRNVRDQLPALKSQLLQSPLIKGVSAAGNPIGNNDLGTVGYEYERNNGSVAGNAKVVQELMVDEDYLSAMEIKLAEGRNFSAAMPADQSGSLLVNETLVKDLGWKNPIGKRMGKVNGDGGKAEWRTVVGVIKDFHTYSLQHKIAPLVMIMPPDTKEEDNLYVRIAKGKISQGVAYLNKVYRQFDKSNPVEFHFLDQNFARQYASEEKQGQIALLFAILAVVIACLGLFGLTTFTVAQRRKEIGIRKVLGAGTGSLVQLLSLDFLKLVVIAVLIALPVSWTIMNKWLQDFAYRINMSWWMFFVAGLLAILIALLTVSFQAIRAAIANPVESLRTE